MIATFMVQCERPQKWPAKNGKPAGEAFEIDLFEVGRPGNETYRGMLPYRLSPDEVPKYWGKLAGKFVRVAITQITQSAMGPQLRGEILGVSDTV